MSLTTKGVNDSKETQWNEFSAEVQSLSSEVDNFHQHVLSNSISSPERSRNYKKCTRLKTKIDSLLNKLEENKGIYSNLSDNFEARNMLEKQKIMSLQTQIKKISKQLEPDECEEEYFRKVKHQDVGESGSEITEDNDDSEEDDCDDDENVNEKEEHESEEEESEEDTWTEQNDGTIMVKRVEALSDFPGEQPDDLAFKQGEILTVIDPREDGWWVAENASGKKGIIPKTLIKIIESPSSPPYPMKDELERPAIEEDDKVEELPSPRRSGKQLWKSLQRKSKQETSVTDVLKALGAMPSGFRSTTLGKMAKDERFHASSWVVPKLRSSHLGFNDLVWNPVHKQLSMRPVKINRVFSIIVARKIPLPGTGIEVLSRQVRIALWDWRRKKILSNIHAVRAVQHEKDALCWNFSSKCDSSIYDSECLARLNSTEDTVGILFELSISYLRSSTNEKSEVSCGWCLLKLFEETGVPASNKNYELSVNGGTPFDENYIELDGSVSVKETPSRFQSIVRTNQQPRMVVKLISFNKTAKELHDLLPESILTCHQYAQFIGQYREITAEVLFQEDRDQFSTDLISDPVVSTFPLLLKFTDIMDSLKRRWENRNKKELKRSQRRMSSVMKNFFREAYMDSAYPLINSAQLPPFLWGDSKREMERLRIILDYEGRPTLENLFSTELLHKPFNIDRVTFNIVSKHSITKSNLTDNI